MFGISVSGIKNSQKHIDVTSNNISIGVNLPADKDNIKPNLPANDPWGNGAWAVSYTHLTLPTKLEV